MDEHQLDALDKLAEAVRQGDAVAKDRVFSLSTGQRVYVALASNNMMLAGEYTIAQAIARLDDSEIAALIKRWQYR